MSTRFVHNARMLPRSDQWADDVHAALLALVGLFNRPEPDATLIAAAGVKLDRTLFPLLSRIGVAGAIGVVELAHLTGKDHSTVSRQVAKLEKLGLVKRQPDPQDSRIRLLVPSPAGAEMIGRLREARHRAIELWFADWSKADREKLLELLTRMLAIAEHPQGERLHLTLTRNMT